MSNSLALPVTMKNFQKLGSSVSPDITICVRGRHAVGKSEGVYQIARKIKNDFYKSDEWEQIKAKYGKELPDELANHTYDDGLPVIERRLSQMTEGDIVGLPFMTENPRTGHRSTAFEPCDWLMQAVEFPVMLFLDERNRALEGVKQAVFQLTDSKAFYGKKLHKDTRIIVAENTGDAYEVNQCDPAEVSRCVTVQLEPTVDEWVAYAKDYCHEATIDFIRERGKKALEHLEAFEPNKKYPDRRAWFKLDQQLQDLDLFEESTSHLLYTVICSFIGVEVGSQFTDYVRNREKNVKAIDIITDWDKAKKRLQGKGKVVPNTAFLACVDKVADYLEKNDKLTDRQAISLARFFYDCPPEPRVNLWAKVTNRQSVIFKLHPLVKDLIVATTSDKDTSKMKKPGYESLKEKEDNSGAAVPAPKKRGGRRK